MATPSLPLDLIDRVHPYTGPIDQGAFDRCIDLAREFLKADRWDGNSPLWITDAYEIHRKVKGPERLPLEALIFETRPDGIYVSLPSPAIQAYRCAIRDLVEMNAKRDFTEDGERRFAEARDRAIQAFARAVDYERTANNG